MNSHSLASLGRDRVITVYRLIVFVAAFTAVVLSFAFGIDRQNSDKIVATQGQDLSKGPNYVYENGDQWNPAHVAVIWIIVAILAIIWAVSTAILRRRRGSGHLTVW